VNPELDAARLRLRDIRRRLADLRLDLAEADRRKRTAKEPIEPVRRETK
jgi:hypothetical protein